MKSSISATRRNTLATDSESRNKELQYMSQYMALLMNKQKLVTLKPAG
jgi:hypothetical protein